MTSSGFTGRLMANVRDKEGLTYGIGSSLSSDTFTDGDWPRFAGDFAGTKYSKLTQINTKNVSSLAQAWTFQGVGTQQTPIVIGGVLYASTPTGAVALDADTGMLIWRYGTVPTPGGGGRGGRARPSAVGAPARWRSSSR